MDPRLVSMSLTNRTSSSSRVTYLAPASLTLFHTCSSSPQEMTHFIQYFLTLSGCSPVCRSSIHLHVPASHILFQHPLLLPISSQLLLFTYFQPP